MPATWPVDIEFKEIILTVDEKTCRKCGSALIIRKDRIHPIYSLAGPLKFGCKLSGGSNTHCSERRPLISPKAEIPLTMPRWRMGWDLLLWIGYKRFKRHGSMPQLQAERLDR